MTESGDGSAPLGYSAFLAAGFAAILALTIVLMFLSIPAGVYAFFFGHLSSSYTWASLGTPYLWIGPEAVWLPFSTTIGSTFLAATLAYVVLMAYAIRSGVGPLRAMYRSVRRGFGSLFESPFLVAVVSIGFLVFTSTLVDSVVSGSAPPADPLVELWSLAYAPLVEEFGFRMIMIGLVAAVLALASFRPRTKAFFKVLWRPSSAIESEPSFKYAIGALAVLSSLTFGYAHVAAGWTSGKFFEATYGGLVLAYLYAKYGFHMSVLAHWGIDYFASAFAFFGQAVNPSIPWNSLTQSYFLEELVSIDLLAVVGIASFLAVVYMGLGRWTKKPPAPPEAAEVHNTPSPGDGQVQ